MGSVFAGMKILEASLYGVKQAGGWGGGGAQPPPPFANTLITGSMGFVFAARMIAAANLHKHMN